MLAIVLNLMIIFEENKDKNDFKNINPKSLGYTMGVG
jgi:hypothetical protein